MEKRDVSEEEILGELISPRVIVIILICAVCARSWGPIVCYLLILAVIKSAFVLLSFIHTQADYRRERKRSLQTQWGNAYIVKVQREMDVEYDRIQVTCEYMDENGEKRIFKSKKIIGDMDCKKGDVVRVSFDPNNYNNYEVHLGELLKK